MTSVMSQELRTERNINVRVLQNTKPEWTPEQRVRQAAISYFRHLVRRERGM